MNRRLFNILMTCAVAVFSLSCNQEDIAPDTPDVPDTPVGEYAKVRFTTADGNSGKASTRAVWHDPKGSGNLHFDWEKYPEDGPGLVVAIHNGETFLYSYMSDTPAEGEEPIGSSLLTVEPVAEEDGYSNRANFETARYYNTEEIEQATYVLAVAPVQNTATYPVHTYNDFLAITSMPAAFTQTKSGDPSFLSDYMIMCGMAEINNGTASIEFEHIPATFRFIITNERPSEATIKSVKISRDDAGSIGSKSALFAAQCTSPEIYRLYDDPWADITTYISGDGAVLDIGEKYTAYAMALPLGKTDSEKFDENAFKDKKLQFTIEASGPDNKHLSFELDADKLAAANPGNVYNWVGGKSYTIRMSLDDGLLVQDITVDDWNEQDISGGEAVEWVNGFSETGDYEPAQLNADGYYEIKNGGNLFWFANHVNTADRTANAVLTANIDLEGRPWTPIGSTGEANNNFRGVFDGQNYTIRGLNVEGGRAGLGFFGEVRTGTVKNFTIYGEVVVNTEVDYVGGVIGSICGLNGENDLERNGAIIQNITSYVNLTAKVHGTGMIGGFVGYANHQSLIEKCSWYGTFDAGEYRVDSGAGGFIGKIQENTSEVTIRNCAAYGTIKTNYAKNSFNNTPTIYMGGFLSFSNTGAKTTLENCLFAGKFERGANLTDEARLGAFGTLRSVNAIKNCYYLAHDGLEAVHSDSDLDTNSDNVEITAVTEEELRGDTIVTKLGECWTRGENYPVIKK